jgi:hypothetical protein
MDPGSAELDFVFTGCGREPETVTSGHDVGRQR